ncbi:MAG: prepilin-type N-terminal cleavage/methylation domain-containing protein [Planctomycetes bacterium]|nr:prepilin-type N-terminal cleavage/methylation domain-containing protein [Planctomycetota bacterium]
MRCRRSSGFTLVEILIALVILMVGIVGIMALYPVAVKNTKTSLQDTTAATVAQSLHSAMTEAMRRAPTDTVTLQHDGTGGKFAFTVPAGIGVPAVYPAPGTAFPLGDDMDVRQAVADIRTMDPTEPYDQYSWQFVVTRVDAQSQLFEVRFRIYRNFDATALYDPMAPDVRADLVQEFSAFILKG